eukprot:m.76995 g.76995  ORF g.76995 m.76995 type:complete len:314 (+) comp8531_c0_seq2:125-1066(+)
MSGVPTSWVKRGFLEKRSQGSGLLSRTNFKTRMFYLTDFALSYYSGTEKSEMKLKRRIPVGSIISCERCDGDAWGKSCMIQVIHSQSTLYIVTKSSVEQADWIEAIWKVCETRKLSLLGKHYHPAVYHAGVWQCCRNKQHNVQGCKVSHDFSRRPGLSTPFEHAEPFRVLKDEDFQEVIDADIMSDVRYSDSAPTFVKKDIIEADSDESDDGFEIVSPTGYEVCKPTIYDKRVNGTSPQRKSNEGVYNRLNEVVGDRKKEVKSPTALEKSWSIDSIMDDACCVVTPSTMPTVKKDEHGEEMKLRTVGAALLDE